jgi:hypothetical protein
MGITATKTCGLLKDTETYFTGLHLLVHYISVNVPLMHEYGTYCPCITPIWDKAQEQAAKQPDIQSRMKQTFWQAM